MICQLYIRDFAVIDELNLELGPRLNLLTGETGAGKSIIVDAINFALGERTGPEVVRTGCDRAVVEAVLDVDRSPEALHTLAEAGLSPEDAQVVVSREIHKSGKTQSRLNGRPVTVSLLKEITDHLVDAHGQHEHQFLLKADRHLQVLDAWGGDAVSSLLAEVADSYGRLTRLTDDLAQLQSDERERTRTIDLYEFQIKEIAEANLCEDEEEELVAERLRLANAERLHASASSVFEALGDRAGDGCALDMLGDALMSLQDSAALDPRLEPVVEGVQSALYQIEDASRELRAYRDSVEFSPERLQELDDRLDLIRGLKRKYGETIGDVIEYGRKLEQDLSNLLHSEERSEELINEIEQLQADTTRTATELSALRTRAGETFAEAVEQELEGLGMAKAAFKVSHEHRELGPTGVDDVEFLISANPGEPPKPLAKIASGGEMSRVMLAIKSIMASAHSMPALIFDEIDVGVGGRTAEVIGRKLDSLASNAQVLCITHLPQIASRSGEHFCIEKHLSEGRTLVQVRRLTEEERIGELARMLGGAAPTETAVQHAREMLHSR